MTSTKFNPNEHLRTFQRRQRQLDGSYRTVEVDYLDVKWRIVWFREVHPQGCIVTELLSNPGESPAVVRAEVSYWDGDQQVVGTGLGSCGEDDWSDWLEKAETRAIGRALGLLGFGTQFCEDFDEVISDAPVDAPQSRSGNGRSGGGSTPPATQNQINFIRKLGAERGLADAALDAYAEDRFSHADWTQITKAQASQLIDALQSGELAPAKTNGKQQSGENGSGDEPILTSQMDAIVKLQKKQNISDADLIVMAGEIAGPNIQSVAELKQSQAAEFIRRLQNI